MTKTHNQNFLRANLGAIIVFAVSFCIFTTAFSLFIYAIHKNFVSSKTYAANGDIAWPVFDGGVDDPGFNANESTINTSNVSNLYQLWSATLPAVADNAVVEEPNVTTSQGVVDLVIANTVKGNLVAYNTANGSKVWEADPSSADFNGQGTKSAPAISGSYVYAYAVDGYIHRYNLTNGTESSGTGFPAQATLLPNNIEKGSASINIANGYLYMTFSGNDGDYGHYVGHVVAVNLSTGTKSVWNAECSNLAELLDATSSDPNYCPDTQSGIWARPGVKVDPVTGNVFVATGNGLYNASSGGHDWGDSLVELKPDLSSMVDSYTPATYASLQSGDADLGSTAPAIFPTQSGSNTPYLLAQAGKDHILRLLNRTNLSGSGAPGHTGGELQTITLSDEVHEQPAVWTDSGGNTWLFVTDESGDFYAYKLVTTSGTTRLVQQYTKSIGTSSSPFVANGIVYIDGNNLLALNATTGAQLYSSSVSLNQHWESPVVVNGTVFTPDDNGNLYAFTVPGNPALFPAPPPATATLIGMISGGDIYVKSPATNSSWAYRLTTGENATQLQMYGDRVAFVDGSNNLWLKDGLSGAWYEEIGSVQSYSLTETGLLVLQSGGNVWYKPGESPTSAWDTSLIASNGAKVYLSPSQMVMIDTAGNLWGKGLSQTYQTQNGWGPSSQWLLVVQNAASAALSDQLFTYVNTQNQTFVKSGGLADGWFGQPATMIDNRVTGVWVTGSLYCAQLHNGASSDSIACKNASLGNGMSSVETQVFGGSGSTVTSFAVGPSVILGLANLGSGSDFYGTDYYQPASGQFPNDGWRILSNAPSAIATNQQ